MPTPFGSYTSSRNWRGAWETPRWDNDGTTAYLDFAIYVARKPNDTLTKYYYISKLYDSDGTGYSAAGAKQLQPKSGSTETYAWHATHYFRYAMGHSAYTKRITAYIAKTDSSGKVNGSELTFSFDFGVPAKSSWWVGYNANGGTSTPGGFTKWFNENATVAGAISHNATSPGNYTVSFNGHGGNTPGSLTSKRTTSYSFKNWNTASNGSGTAYNAGATYSANSGATLYAQWNTSESRAAVTLPNCTRTNYVFKGWYTAESGGTYIGKNGTSYTPTGNITLHAQWYAPYTVSYNANGGSGAPGNQVKVYNTNLTLSSTKPTRSGYSFVRWNTNTSDTGTAYNPGATYSSNANLTLYAIWNRTVSFNANYTGGTNPAALTSRSYTAITLPTMTRTGWKFVDWNTAANGSGTSYTTSYPADTSSVNYPDITLYAQWKRNIDSVVITGNANAMRINVDYIQVIPEGTENPLELNWYESAGPDMYLRSADTTVNTDKLYYRIEPIVSEVDDGRFAYITVPVMVNGAAAADVSATITVASENGVSNKVIVYNGAASKLADNILDCTFVAMALDCETDLKYNINVSVTATNTSVSQADVTATRKMVISMAYYTMDVLGDSKLIEVSADTTPSASKEYFVNHLGEYEQVDLSGYDNLAKSTAAVVAPAEYNALRINLDEWLEAEQTYTLQLWDVDVSHSAKAEADLGVAVYYCGGNVTFGGWYGEGRYFTNGHAEHLSMTFTPHETTPAETSTAGEHNNSNSINSLNNTTVVSASTPFLKIYNSVPNTAGTMNLTVGSWKLEKGSEATAWTNAIGDFNPSTLGWYEKSGPRPGHGMAFGAPAVHESFNVAMPPECYGEPWIPTFKTSSIANFVVPNGVNECMVLDTSTGRFYRWNNGFTPVYATPYIAESQGAWIAPYSLQCKASANGQEWSIDLCDGTTSFTGTYFQIWSSKLSKSIARFYTDNCDVETFNNVYCNTNTGFIVKPPNINLAASNNGLASGTVWPCWEVVDKSGRIVTRLEAVINSNGNNGFNLYARNYNTSGTQVGQGGISGTINKSGTMTYSVSSAANFRSAIGAAASSDRRLKDHICYIGKKAVDFVKSLKPAVFDRHGGGETHREMGFYAQDVRESDIWETELVHIADPEKIHDDERFDDGTLLMDYKQLIAPLVAAVQDLTQRVEELEERIGE